MEEITPTSFLKPIKEKEREVLQNKLNEQRLELEEKKRRLEELISINENATGKSDTYGNEELPDPDKMVQEFLDSLEKKFEKRNENEDDKNEKEKIYAEKELNNLSASGDCLFQKGNSTEEHPEQSTHFRATTAVKPFNFKINKINTAKVINIAPKGITCFDKSIQVDLLPIEENRSTKEKKKTEKRAQLIKSATHKKKEKAKEKEKEKGTKHDSPMKKSSQKKNTLTKGKKKKQKKKTTRGKKGDPTEAVDENGQKRETGNLAQHEEEGEKGEKGGEEEDEDEGDDDDDQEDEEEEEEEGEEEMGEGEGEGEEEEENDEVEEEIEAKGDLAGGVDDVETEETEEETEAENENGIVKISIGTGEKKKKMKNIYKKKTLKKTKAVKTLDEEQKKKILQSPNFIKFIESTSKIVERTLGEQNMFNTMFDFAETDLVDETENVEKLKMLNKYYCKKYTNTRPVTDVRTSNIYSDLFLASYGLSETATSIDPDGYVLVWNTTMNNRPEYVFTSQSAVCTALFNKFNPHIIIGGTYTGSVVLWDIRAKNKPVQKTLLSSQGHMHPIYCAEVVGTKNSHNLVTADTDGRLCKWSLSMFNSPADTIDLKKGIKEISCCCFSFQEGEINTLYGGAEDGSLFQAQIHGTKVGVVDVYNVHHGPLTATEFHPIIEGTDDHNDIILTASVDWTCKLLSVRNLTKPLISIDGFEGYLMDVKWNPTNTGMFASCCCNGGIKLWNVANALECPYFEAMDNGYSTNKLAWSHDGKKLIAGDSQGYLTLWAASNDVYQPKSEDIAACEEVFAKLKTENEAVDLVDTDL